MRAALDLRAQQSGAEHAVGDAVATVGECEQDPVLRRYRYGRADSHTSVLANQPSSTRSTGSLM